MYEYIFNDEISELVDCIDCQVPPVESPIVIYIPICICIYHAYIIYTVNNYHLNLKLRKYSNIVIIWD